MRTTHFASLPGLPALALGMTLAFCFDRAPAEPAPSPAWTVLHSGSSALLRGVSAASPRVVWASGSGGTVLRSEDGGSTWDVRPVPPAPGAPGAPGLDFRDVDAVDDSTAYLLSIGPGAASRIHKTRDGGATWTLQHTNPEPQGFLDAMSFWDADHGLVVGDSIAGHFHILLTDDGGSTWTRVPDGALLPALPNEGAFAASGSNIAVVGRDQAWIAMQGRVLHTADRGRSWTVVATPMATGDSAGIFSVAFRDRLHGVIVGGDYKQERATGRNVAWTEDGGLTWVLAAAQGLSGFRSAVAYLPGAARTLIAIGPQGADRSDDDGHSWSPMALPAPQAGFHAFSFAPGLKTGLQTAWAVGNGGALARFQLQPPGSR
jgi:photosystem II stability/assembly factor-like uncharacterized protein